jgi:hypothetical protein
MMYNTQNYRVSRLCPSFGIQPSQFGYLSHLDLPYQGWGDQIKEIITTSYSPHWFTCLILTDSIFTAQLELEIGNNLVSLFSCHVYIWVLVTLFVGQICAKMYHLQLYYSSTLCKLHNNSYCIFSCYTSWTDPGVRCLYIWCYVTYWLTDRQSQSDSDSDMGCPSAQG